MLIFAFVLISLLDWTLGNLSDLSTCFEGVRVSWFVYENLSISGGQVMPTYIGATTTSTCIAACASTPECQAVNVEDGDVCKLFESSTENPLTVDESQASHVAIFKDQCADSPCQSGGTCSNLVPPVGYQCKCPDSCIGSLCQRCDASLIARFEEIGNLTLNVESPETVLVESKVGKGIRLTGQPNWAYLGPFNDCFVIPGSYDCSAKTLTVSLWLKIHGSHAGSFGGIVSSLNYDGSKWTAGFDAYYNNNKMYYKVREWPDKEYEINKSPRPADHTWNYLTWVWEGYTEEYLRYYENGIKQTGTLVFRSRPLIPDPPMKVIIGRLFDNRDGNYANMELDNLIILDEALSSEDVLDLFISEQ